MADSDSIMQVVSRASAWRASARHEYSAHSLMHTARTQILLNGGTMSDVQNVLRHSTPATSQLYVNTIMKTRG